jgi:hypothetical protein
MLNCHLSLLGTGYETGSGNVAATSSGLVAKDFVTSLSSTVTSFFAKLSRAGTKESKDSLCRYLTTLEVPRADGNNNNNNNNNLAGVEDSERLLHAMLCFYDVPSADVLVKCKGGKRNETLTPAMLMGYLGNQRAKLGGEDGVSPRGLVAMLRSLRSKTGEAKDK